MTPDPQIQEQVTNEHTEHCCFMHGCKYEADDCPVTAGKAEQSSPCDDCVLESKRDEDALSLRRVNDNWWAIGNSGGSIRKKVDGWYYFPNSKRAAPSGPYTSVGAAFNRAMSLAPGAEE